MDYEKKEYFKFHEQAGGYFPFDGVFDNDKEIQNIVVDRDNSTATINYADGCSYSISATITKSGNNFTITNIRKTWSDGSN